LHEVIGLRVRFVVEEAIQRFAMALEQLIASITVSRAPTFQQFEIMS
jgi:hypothetical protein